MRQDLHVYLLILWANGLAYLGAYFPECVVWRCFTTNGTIMNWNSGMPRQPPCRLRSERRGSARDRDNHGHLAVNEIGQQRRKSIVLILRPAAFDRYVLALDIAGFAQTLTERANGPRTRQEIRSRGIRSLASWAAARAPRAATPPRRP